MDIPLLLADLIGCGWTGTSQLFYKVKPLNSASFLSFCAAIDSDTPIKYYRLKMILYSCEGYILLLNVDAHTRKLLCMHCGCFLFSDAPLSPQQPLIWLPSKQQQWCKECHLSSSSRYVDHKSPYSIHECSLNLNQSYTYYGKVSN